MLDDAETVSLRSDPGEAPTTRRDAPHERSDLPGKRPSAPDKEPRSRRRRWLRGGLFLLLPIALIVGAYWYVTGGQAMSTDDAYVEADKVGVSTDVSGIVQAIDVTENQRVETAQVLYRLDDLPFRLALQRAEAQVGIIRNDLNALKANYQDMQAQIRQAQNDIDYYDREFRRQQDLVGRQVVSQSSFDTARRNLQNAQQRLASLNQQLAAVAANLSARLAATIRPTFHGRRSLAAGSYSECPMAFSSAFLATIGQEENKAPHARPL
jgi:membrane fusion protein, multidrug efflux system